MSLKKENRPLTDKSRSQIDGFCPDSENYDGATFGQSLINFNYDFSDRERENRFTEASKL